MNRRTIANLLAACAVFAGLAGAASQAEAQYTIKLDCHGPNGVPSWSHTGSTINIEMNIDGNWWVVQPSGTGHAGPVPASLCDQEYEVGGAVGSKMKTGMVSGLRIWTSGSDAFWVDRLKLTQTSNGAWWEWGVDGGAGFCFSTDPNDGESSCWNGAAYQTIYFNM